MQLIRTNKREYLVDMAEVIGSLGLHVEQDENLKFNINGRTYYPTDVLTIEVVKREESQV
jgi:hypothetical protein